MRVAIFHSQFTGLGGAEILLTMQARWLVAAGHDVRLLAFRVDPAYAAEHLAGLRVDEVGYPKGIAKAEALSASVMPELSERAARHLTGVDAVMAYNYPSAPVIAAATRDARRVWYACEPFRALYLEEGNPFTAERALRMGRGAPDFATTQLARRITRRRLSRTLLPWTARAERALKAFDSQGIGGLDAVASLSRYGASCVAQATARADAGVIYPMVGFADVASRRQGLRRDAPQLLVQTRIAVPKNLDTLFRAVARVRRVHPGTTLHVVGSGGGRKALEGIEAELMPGGVRFHGFLSTPDLDALSAACDIFAFVPVDEPFGMVFPEAAARGLLLVGSNHGGPREILEDGAVGALCDPFDPESVADAILRTLALPDAAADAQRAAANASVRARFSPDVIGRQLEAFLRG